MIGTLPSLILKTDETRIQSCPELLQEFEVIPHYVTTKINGSSHSICVHEDGVLQVTGHYYEFKDDGNSPSYKFIKAHHIDQNLKAAKTKTVGLLSPYRANGLDSASRATSI